MTFPPPRRNAMADKPGGCKIELHWKFQMGSVLAYRRHGSRAGRRNLGHLVKDLERMLKKSRLFALYAFLRGGVEAVAKPPVSDFFPLSTVRRRRGMGREGAFLKSLSSVLSPFVPHGERKKSSDFGGWL